jgi:hypothetical protein
MPNVSLRWYTGAVLQEWAEHHWYYLPESMETEQMQQEWMHTMQEILLELQSRDVRVTLEFFDNTPSKGKTDENNQKSN